MDPCAQATPRRGLEPNVAAVTARHVAGNGQAKADAAGMFGVAWLVRHGALPRERLAEYYCSYVAGIFRSIRLGTGDAHGRSQLMQLNYLVEREVIERDAGKARQALCSGGAGDKAEPYLGLADLRARVGHTIVSRHRQLEPAPKSGAVNGGDKRFRAILHLQEQLDEFRAALLARGDLAEFLNVRSSDEGIAGPH